ncbi:hypothetical protein ACM66Z_07525 [Sulfurovum sp. ST-21]|uniref:Uncharacterized protein n=1 Tax=Sulfurovum indicum TaxID=2779528 RepID=A0A7M1S1S1_9BACT|nr:hypothetical protein [Sulfurovum indicum]QOR61296.1 hypothetical protein IMZ28_07520 [Sulfurovum indicum]
MGFFSSLFSNKAKVSYDQKVLEYITIFKDASLAMVTKDLIKSDDNKMKMYMYFFGVIDYVAQHNNISDSETIAILKAFLMNELNVPSDKVRYIANELMDNTTNEYYMEYMVIGGNAISAWANGDSFAPMKLLDILNPISKDI